MRRAHRKGLADMPEVLQPQPVRVSMPDLPPGYTKGAGGMLGMRAFALCDLSRVQPADVRG